MLDDDDIWYTHHLATLVRHQQETGADLVYPWFEVEGGEDPLKMMGKPFDPDELRRRNYIPIPYLVRTGLAQAVGGFQCPVRPTGPMASARTGASSCACWTPEPPSATPRKSLGCGDTGGEGLPGQPGNTSGRPDRW